MEKVEKFLDKYFWLVIIFLAMPAIWALLVPGFYGASDDIHIAWLQQMHKTLLSGKIPPRFIPDLSFGFGYPLFNFLYPLPFYIAEVFHLSGFSLVDSIKLLFLLSFPLSGIFMYLLLKQYAGSFLSLAGALLYIYTPYRSVDVYIRGAIGEIVSFICLPLIVLSVIKLAKIEKSLNYLRWIGIGALSLASLVLSHNITAYMFLPFVFLLALFEIFLNKGKKKIILNLILTGFLALLISSYFWIPAFLESRLVKYDTVFNFVDHFPTLRQLVTPYWGYGASVAGPGDGLSFFLGITNLLLVVSSAVCFFIYKQRFKKEEKIIFVWILICLVISIFLMNYRSTFVWNVFPYFSYFQFPWRFLIITTFCIPILIISFKYIKWNKIISIAIILLTLSTTYSYFRPQDFLGRTDEYFLNRYIPTPKASEEYLKTQEEYLRLPVYTKFRPDKNYPLVEFSGGEIKNITRLNDFDSKIEIFSNQKKSFLNYNKYFFPGWNAKIDGFSAPLSAGYPFGQITLKVPSGSHLIEIKFQETPFKMILDFISLIAFLLSVAFLFKKNLFKLLKSVKIR